MKIIHVTDPHVTPPGEFLFGKDPGHGLAMCINDINANHSDADMCIFSGDLTHRGHPDAYRRVATLLENLIVPYRLMIGNHDDRAVFRQEFPSAPVDPNGFVQTVVEIGEAAWILLDTVDQGNTSGYLCSARLDWLDDQLHASSDRPVYLVTHHCPSPIDMPHFTEIGLTNEAEFAERLHQHSNVRMILSGHVHRPISGLWRGLPFATMRGTNHQFALNFVESRSLLTLEPPAYGIVAADEIGLRYHLHEFAEQAVISNARDPNQAIARFGNYQYRRYPG